MRNILIAGENSYIGTRFERFMSAYGAAYAIKAIDMVDGGWKGADFSRYDAIFMVAGIVHRRETDKDKALYDRVNGDLPVEVAELARAAGVRQFVFLSSMSVYGDVRGMIDERTPTNPNTHYGRSKLAAEVRLRAMDAQGFRVAILRPPMVYGPGCRGNYPRLKKLALKLPAFPRTGNRRSMIYIDHLLGAVKLIIDGESSGTFCPQDAAYVDTSEMAKLIAQARGHRLAIVPGLTGLMRALGRTSGTLGKAFGDLYYDQALSGAPGDYRPLTLAEAIQQTESEDDE